MDAAWVSEEICPIPDQLRTLPLPLPRGSAQAKVRPMHGELVAASLDIEVSTTLIGSPGPRWLRQFSVPSWTLGIKIPASSLTFSETKTDIDRFLATSFFAVARNFSISISSYR